MRRLPLTISAAALLAVLAVAPRADAASILYNITDLGVDHRASSNPDGSYSGVTNASGKVTYTFTKSPVTSIDIQSQSNQGHDFTFQHLTLQSGPFQVGVNEVRPSMMAPLIVPSFETPTNLSYGNYQLIGNAWIGTDPLNTVRDVNVLGQAVGQGVLPETIADGKNPTSYAAFSAIGLKGHGGYAPTVDNLNNYIAPLPGVTLSAAFKIDDLGRILAGGSDNHDYLLTPVALGNAATVPEPTTLAMFGMGALLLATRNIRRNSHQI